MAIDPAGRSCAVASAERSNLSFIIDGIGRSEPARLPGAAKGIALISFVIDRLLSNRRAHLFYKIPAMALTSDRSADLRLKDSAGNRRDID